MTKNENRQWLLDIRPTGKLTGEEFCWNETSVPQPSDGQVLVRNLCLSVDPAQRTWMMRDSYKPKVSLGEVVQSSAVGQALESRHTDFKAGDLVRGDFGCQDYAPTDGKSLGGMQKLPPDMPPISPIEEERSREASRSTFEEVRNSEARLRKIIDTIPTLAWCTLPGGQRGECEGRLRRFDGVYRWFLFRAEPLRDESGNIVNWYGTDTDIDDLKRAEVNLRQDEEELRCMADAIPQSIVVLSPGGDMLYANRAALEYTGLSMEEFQGDDFRPSAL